MQRRWLRRYHSEDAEICPDMPGDFSYHQAMIQVDDGPEKLSVEGYVKEVPASEYPLEDFPTKCSCGFEFTEKDRPQVLTRTIYKRVDTKETGELGDFPPGAMFRSKWREPRDVGPDGNSISVTLPPKGGEYSVWCIDGPSSSGGRWTRTGTPPNLTVSPSILTGSYHGFLQNGMLTDSLGDRPLPPGPD